MYYEKEVVPGSNTPPILQQQQQQQPPLRAMSNAFKKGVHYNSKKYTLNKKIKKTIINKVFFSESNFTWGCNDRQIKSM
jgi:hypothetical protein